jgi:hypothetical protein
MVSRSIEALLAVTTELRLIAAMWDHASEEVSLDWWSRNPAILVVGTDPAFEKTLSALIRMMFKRTSELLLAQGPDPTGRRSNWLVLDDLTAVGPLDGLRELCLRGGAGGCIVAATLQELGHVRHHYQREAEELLGSFFNQGLLRSDDVTAADWYNRTTPTERSPKAGVYRPAFLRDHFLNMPPAGPAGLHGAWRSDLGEPSLDNNGVVRKIATTWFGALSRDSTFDKLMPPAADVPGFLPRPPEHQRLRPFGKADYDRLQLRPPSSFMWGEKHAL